jgi:hypothetical protein
MFQACSRTTNCGQFDLIVDFCKTAVRYRSDGLQEGGWFRCVLADLASERRGKVLLQDLSLHAILFLASPEGIACLKNITADYLSFTEFSAESDHPSWILPEFKPFFDSITTARHSDVKNSSFAECKNIKTITWHLGGSYIYFKGYDARPYQDQTWMIHFPGTQTCAQLESLRKQWVEWRSKAFGLNY